MRIHWRPLVRKLLLVGATGLFLGPAAAQAPPLFPAWSPETAPPPAPCDDPLGLLQGPLLSEGQAPKLPAARLEDEDKPLPINLATALRLAGGRPIEIAAAEASLRTAQAQYDQARLLWLPNVYAGASYYRHDGGAESHSGNLFNNRLDQFMAGGGSMAIEFDP